MNTGTKVVAGITIAGALALAIKRFAPSLVKLKNLTANLFLETSFERVHGIIKGKNTIRIFIRESIRNFSGFDLEVNNLFVVAESSTNNGKDWDVVAYQPERISSMKIPDGKTVSGAIPIDFKFSFLQNITEPKTKYRIVTTYDFKGIQQKQITPLDLSAASTKIASTLKKMFGLSGTDATTNETYNLQTTKLL